MSKKIKAFIDLLTNKQKEKLFNYLSSQQTVKNQPEVTEIKPVWKSRCCNEPDIDSEETDEGYFEWCENCDYYYEDRSETYD